MMAPDAHEAPGWVAITVDMDPGLATLAAWRSALPRVRLPPLPDELLIVTGAARASEPNDPATVMSRALNAEGRASHVLRPPLPRQRLGSLVIGRRDWTRVAIGGRGSVLEDVPVPRALAGESLLEVVDLDEADASPITLWSRYVHPRLWAVAGPTARRAPINADIGLGIEPVLVVIAGRHGSLGVAAATPDIVAAELLTLALRGTTEESLVGPWEDPVVQRATELELGVVRPDQIFLDPILPPHGSLMHSALASLVDHVKLRLGIPAEFAEA